MEKIGLVYNISTEDYILEYPLEIEIQGDFLLVYPEDFPIPIGKLELKCVLSSRPSTGNHWDHSSIYLKKSSDSDLDYCRQALVQGKYDDELRAMMSLPDLEDYRVLASLSTEKPVVSALLVNGNPQGINEGNPIILESLSIRDTIRFENGAKARLSLVYLMKTLLYLMT